ncbi:hypothetical protein [Hydrogenophaga sp.]|uniref:hypothetical protein n=1 Tax=Hydrogenophaga sp. TaxID=1904254 RepID=UPI00271E2D71|nr:hypothetical protein [Hydrogenophaga sp.]MDO9437043.1 hypothetical protein [Hydrogenophaga sp.]
MNTRDPRGALLGNAGEATFSAAEYAHFYKTEPQEKSGRARYWYARGQNFVVAYVHADSGEAIKRLNQPDEYAILLPDPSMRIRIEWNDAPAVDVQGHSLVIVPPGRSTVTVLDGGALTMVFSSRSADLCAKCVNAASYAQPHANIPPFTAWPAPVDGWKVRIYSLDVPEKEGRFGRIWRCSTLMINVVPPSFWNRGPTQLSPHHHDTFEQGSMALRGSYTHHLRWPWTGNRLQWRKDEHEQCGSPSLAVIPAKVVHTSEELGEGEHLMLDIFSPPRMDFSSKPGWVLNAAEYPMPEPVTAFASAT